jgi:hypothetical protein
VNANPQTSIDEKPLENGDLEKALEARYVRNVERLEAAKKYKEADDRVRVMLEEFSLADGEVARCGRFRIEKKKVAPRSVAWESAGSSRLQISLIEPE